MNSNKKLKIKVSRVDKDAFFPENQANAVFVNKMPKNTNDSEFYDSFRQYGELIFCEVIRTLFLLTFKSVTRIVT